MIRIVAPIEAVERAHPVHDLLRALQPARRHCICHRLPDGLAGVCPAQVRGGVISRAEILDRVIDLDAVAAVLLDRRDVERRENVQVRQARLLQLLQVLSADEVRICERRELAAVGVLQVVGLAVSGRVRIVAAEVAYVELIDHALLGRLEVRQSHVVPLPGVAGLQIVVVEVDELAAHAVGGEAYRVWVGDLVRNDRVGGIRIDLERDCVELAVPVARALDLPDARLLVERHRLRLELLAGGVVDVDAHARILERSRCPHGKRRYAGGIRRTEGLVVGGLGIQVVECARDLHPRRAYHGTLGVAGDGHQLAARDVLRVRGRGAEAPGLQIVQLLVECGLRIGAARERDGLIRAREAERCRRDARIGRGEQFDLRRARRRVEQQRVGGDPVRGGVRDHRRRRRLTRARVGAPGVRIDVLLAAAAVQDDRFRAAVGVLHGHGRVRIRRDFHAPGDARVGRFRGDRYAVVRLSVHHDLGSGDASLGSRVRDVDGHGIQREPCVRGPAELLDADVPGRAQILDLHAGDARRTARAVGDFVHADGARPFVGEGREELLFGVLIERIDAVHADLGAVRRRPAAAVAVAIVGRVLGDGEHRAVLVASVESELPRVLRGNGEFGVESKTATANHVVGGVHGHEIGVVVLAAVCRVRPVFIRDLESVLDDVRSELQPQHQDVVDARVRLELSLGAGGPV